MDSDTHEGKREGKQERTRKREFEELVENNTGEGAASALEHLHTQIKQHRRVAGDSPSEAVPSDT
jgi:hypothetical protein